MPTLRRIIAEAEVTGMRRAKLRTLPDPMELAKLATSLKPDLAGGTPSQQREVVALAKSLFDIAIEIAARPSRAERAKIASDEVVSSVQQRVKQEDAEGYFVYDPKSKIGDELRGYLGKQLGAKAPKTYRNGWAKFVEKHGFRQAGQRLIAKKVVDEEVARRRKKDRERP